MGADRLRVIVWGPGGLGTICIREIALSNAFELVGVHAYSADKDGKDAGTLIGGAPVGVTVTTDAAALLAVACDCILYTARDYGNYSTDDEILRLLEAGKNVLTVLPYQYVEIARSADFLARIEAACRAGGSVFHATGVNPVLLADRVVLALTGLCNDVRATCLQEFWDASNVGWATLEVCGFGASLAVAQASPIVAAMADNFLKQELLGWAEIMGIAYDRITTESDFGLADARIDLGDGHGAEPGTVGRVTRRWSGFVDERGPKPFLMAEVNWVIAKSMLPACFGDPVGYQGWLVTIEGRPSIRSFIEMRADLASDERYLIPGDPTSDAGYTAVVATLLQMVPLVRRAAPGILPTPLTPVHWRPDPRAA